MFMRSKDGGLSRPVEKLPINYLNIADIKNCIGNRLACTYIRPLQKPLHLTETDDMVCSLCLFIIHLHSNAFKLGKFSLLETRE